jgi:hypothetical protein
VFYTPDVSYSVKLKAVVNGVNYTQIMQTFATKNANRTGVQLKMENPMTGLIMRLMLDYTVGPDRIYDMVPVANSDFIYNYALNNPNSTAWGMCIEFVVSYCSLVLVNDYYLLLTFEPDFIIGVSFSQPANPVPINIQYQLWFNATNTANGSDIFGRTVLSFVRGLDESIISILNDPTATVTASIDVNLKDWPLIPPTTLSDTIVQQLGPVFFFCNEMVLPYS